MPKAKRRKNIFGFGRKSSGNYIPASGGIAKHAPKHRAKAGASDSKYDDVAKSLAGKPYKSLSTSQQATVRGIASKMNPKRKRKRNLEIGLPKNKWANAKVRMKGGKIQVMADERILGKAGFKAGAGLSGVSVSGGAKLNPSARALLSRIGYSLKKAKGGYETYPTRGAGAVGYFRTLAEVERYAKRVAHDRGFTTNPVKRTHKTKGGFTGLRSMLTRRRTPKQVGKAFGTKKSQRYLVGTPSGGTLDRPYASTMVSAKKKGNALARKNRENKFWVQNQVTGSILNFDVT